MAQLSIPNYTPISSLHVFNACIRVFNSCSFSVVWCWPCISCWFFLAIHDVCFYQFISWVRNLVTSSLYEIVMVITHFTGRFLAGFSPQLTFSSCCQLHSTVFHCILGKHRVFCTFWDNLFSRFVGPCHMPFCSQSEPQLDFLSGLTLLEYLLINVPLQHNFGLLANKKNLILNLRRWYFPHIL